MDIIDWKIMCNGLNNIINNKIVLYGASRTCEGALAFLTHLNLQDKLFAIVDSDEKKWGNTLLNYKILSPYILNEIMDDVLVIITSTYLKEIINFLDRNLNCNKKICSIFSYRMALHYDIMNNRAYYIKNDIILKYKNYYNIWKNNLISKRMAYRKQCFLNTIRCIIEYPHCILVHGIQKTGNNSIITSLNCPKKLNNMSFTTHFLYNDRIDYNELKEVLRHFNNHEIKIISGVREPIERIISQKWHYIGCHYQNNDTCIPTIIDENYDNYITDLITYQESNPSICNSSNIYYASVHDWFEDHIQKLFDINIFEYPFDKSKGYSIIKKDNISIFIYRLDKLSKLEKEIGRFVSNKSFKLKKQNVAFNKPYWLAYKKYLKEVQIKKEFFNKLIDNGNMTHFYTNEELKKYKYKWSNKLI